MILSLHIVPKINRFFWGYGSFSRMQLFMLFVIDTTVCYLVFKKVYNHLNMNRFVGSNQEKKTYEIFD